jgi:hypothetical protein
MGSLLSSGYTAHFLSKLEQSFDLGTQGCFAWWVANRKPFVLDRSGAFGSDGAFIYGRLHGKVASVLRDSIIRDKPSDMSSGSKHGELAEASEPDGRNCCARRVSFGRTEMQIEGNPVGLAMKDTNATRSRSIC